MTRQSRVSRRRRSRTLRPAGGIRRRRSAFLFAAIAAGASARAATFTVTSTGDAGHGSLRQAILDANSNPGPDTIAFAIAGSSVHTIAPASPLPAISDTVTLDGFTQPGSSPNSNGPGQPDDSVHQIELDGTNTSPDQACLTVGPGAGGSIIRGIVVNRCPGDGILLLDSGGSNKVAGTFVGVDPSGRVALGVGGSGVHVHSSSDAAGEPGDTVGGDTAADRNVISGATLAGVTLESGTNTVLGNFIGTDASGESALPNGSGVFVNGSHNSIGGETPDARNVVSGNAGRGVAIGILLGDASETDNVVAGNFIGTDVAGHAALGNGGSGVGVYGPSNTVGGAAPGAGNVISANACSGVEIIAGDQTAVLGNRIGLDAFTAATRGNALAGVAIHAYGAVVGGLDQNGANTIASSGTAGVIVFGGSGNTIRGNSIYGNADLGIDLGNDGANFNDELDEDDGPNELQNYPILSSVTTGATTHIQGVLHSSPSTEFQLDFYANPPCIRYPADFVEGKTYLGSTQVQTDGFGASLFSVSLATPTEAGARIAMTATDPDGSTSELSKRLPFSVTPEAGPGDSGQGVAIAGTDFETGAQVTIGGLPAGDVEVADFNTITASVPDLAPGTLNDVTVINPDGSTGTLEKGYVADFLDVPEGHQFYMSVTRLVTSTITAGVGRGMFGVDDPTLRQQMAVFLLKAKHGACYAPPPCTGVFADVPCPSQFADWIEQLAAENVTGGCGNGDYCPLANNTRGQMAVFIAKAFYLQ